MPEPLTEDDVQDLLDGDGIWVVHVYASWTGQMMSNILESVEDAFNEVQFGEFDVDEHEDAAAELEIRSIPTVIILDGGEELDRKVSMVKESALKEWIEEQSGATDTSSFPSNNLP